MNEIKLNDRPEELIQAEHFVVEGKFEEAHQLMDKFLESGENTFKDSLSCNLLKIDILIQKGLYEDAIKFANQTYEQRIELKNNILTFDILNLVMQRR